MSKKKIGINGFGRIGRTSTRVWWQKLSSALDLNLINTSGSMEIEDWAHLLKYDSNYGPLEAEIRVERAQSVKDATDANPVLGQIFLGERAITVTAQRQPNLIPWGQFEVETVIEATGAFLTREKAGLHLEGGAKNVIISAPAKGDDVPSSVKGVNPLELGQGTVASNESCTTNCVAPVAQVIHQAFGVKSAMLTTIHSYTDDQNTHDNSHRDLRRARSAAENIIPTSTGAAKATTRVIPELSGLFDGLAVRVPTPVGSLSDMVFVLNRPTNVEEVNRVLSEAATSDRWQGILAVTNEPIVSSDIVGRTESSIVDLSLTNVVAGNMVKIISWYDNEYGYCNRLLEQALN